MIPLVTNLVLAVADVAALVVLHRTRAPSRALLVVAVAFLVVTVAGRFALGWGMFGLLQATAWAGFLHLPVLLVAMAVVTRRAVPALLAGVVALVGLDAFFVEPSWLEVTTTRIAVPGLAAPLRVVLVADLQTDEVGAHERAAIEAVKAADPDLVLFAGDYIQTRDMAVFAAQRGALQAALVGLAPRLGSFAVRGDVDPDAWPTLFEGLPIEVVTSSRTFDLGPVVLTALAPLDAASSHPPIPPTSKPHLVLAHRPDVSLTAPDADLILAGHIHGGQVRLPFIGPLMTLSNVPRSWAVGLTALPRSSSGAARGQLYVSRGVGMERYDAPRLRFLCRPELAILDLEPGE
ncbi:MAG: hypothetical protein Q8P41_15655 [Pseudomonadota bacterium]|nr:hypothetical protein [Pseudomonadota bacterium]